MIREGPEMIMRFLSAPLTLPIWVHATATALAYVWLGWVQGRLDASYAASGHPVDYATGQTQFSGTAVKGYYQHMIDLGTLDIYRQTQLIDFGFILGIFAFGWMFGTLLARFGRPQSWAHQLGLMTAANAMIAAMSDSIENLISFVMLAQPQGFANWIALPYSDFAVLKFALITLAMAAAIGTVILLILGRALNRPKIG